MRSTSTSTSAAALTHSVALTLLSTTSASIRVRVQLAPSQSLPPPPSSHRLLLLLHAVARSGARDALRSCANTLVEHYLNAVPTGCFFQVCSVSVRADATLNTEYKMCISTPGIRRIVFYEVQTGAVHVIVVFEDTFANENC